MSPAHVGMAFCVLQARLRSNRYELEALQAAVGAAAAATGRADAAGRQGHVSPSRQAAFGRLPGMPPGYEPADAVGFQRPRDLVPRDNPAAAGAARAQQQQRQARPYADFGQAMAHMLLSMPMPRAPGRASGGSGARRGLPASLVQMREAVLGMQRAGLPPQLLFSDRDFTAGGLRSCVA